MKAITPEAAVEFRLGEKSASQAQDFIPLAGALLLRAPKRGFVLALQRSTRHAVGDRFRAAAPRALASVQPLSLAMDVMAALRVVLACRLLDHAQSAFHHLWGISCRFLVHGSILSKIGDAQISGPVQCDVAKNVGQAARSRNAPVQGGRSDLATELASVSGSRCIRRRCRAQSGGLRAAGLGR